MEVDQPDLFFSVEYMDVDSPVQLSPSMHATSLSSHSSSEIEFSSDEEPTSIDTPTLLRKLQKRLGYEIYDMLAPREPESDRQAEFRERRLHSDIFFNSPLDGLTYCQGDDELEEAQQSGQYHIIEDCTSQDDDEATSSSTSLNTAEVEALQHNQTPLTSENNMAVQDLKAERVAWFVPQPPNLKQVKNTPLCVLEQNALTRIEQNFQLEEICYWTDPQVGFGGMDKYYAWKYGDASRNDPFVQRWLRAMKGPQVISDAPTSRVSEFPASEGDVQMELMGKELLEMVHRETVRDDAQLLNGQVDRPDKTLEDRLMEMVDVGTDTDDVKLLRNRPDFEAEALQEICIVKMIAEGTALDDLKLLRDHSLQALEHGYLGEAIAESAPNLLFVPNDRRSGESSRTTPIAVLQSMRRRRPLPKLPELKTWF